MTSEQLRLLEQPGGQPNGAQRDGDLAASAICAAFDPVRLTQARHLAGLTKRSVADELGISPAAVGQWETGASTPRRDHVLRLAEVLDVLPAFFVAGRPHARLDVGAAHFRSLRSTPAGQRAKAIAFVEQVWELAHALEKRVQLPPVQLPGFANGESTSSDPPSDPIGVAQHLRTKWGLGSGPIPHLVRTMEKNGLIITLVRFAGEATATVDAFSTSRMPRPIVVLTPDRADNVYRHRFTAAHELGHLLLHTNAVPGDPIQEKQADAFAAEFLTPRDVIAPLLPFPMDLRVLATLSRSWGVSVDSLVYRCREVGAVSDAAYRRVCQHLNKLHSANVFSPEPVSGYPGENPVLLSKAFELAQTQGLTLPALSRELKIKIPRLRLLLGQNDTRPTLKIV
jgi:Zn-dependent peptidase ImmA (M78 family)/transcriptional regulator with XRE-family HTH domain